MSFNIIEFLRKAIDVGASDVHLRVGERPSVRLDSMIVKYDEMPLLTEEDIYNAVDVMVPEHLTYKAKTAPDLDFSYEIKGESRFRVNLSRQVDKPALVLRLIPYEIKTLRELNMPKIIEEFAKFKNGLVLITGATGSGKSTTIAALINMININDASHIVTIEDPIEFVFTNKRSIISQRQIGLDTATFTEGIKYSLRQDPDVIFIGEVRDQDTVVSALTAAETGHLVFATIHTNDAVSTVNRVVNMFEPSNRDFVRNQLAGSLRGTISQKLIPLASGKGRRAACEVLISTPTIKDYIEKGQLDDIYHLSKTGVSSGLITMNNALYEMHRAKLITEESALAYSNNKPELEQMMRGVYQGSK
jgi:twitching motility protein PilT